MTGNIAETIQELDHFNMPCLDLREVGSLSDKATFDELCNSPEGKELIDVIDSHVRQDFSPEDLQKYLREMQGLQGEYLAQQAPDDPMPLLVYSADEISDHRVGMMEKNWDTAKELFGGVFEAAHDDKPAPEEPDNGLRSDVFSIDRAADDFRNRGAAIDEVANQIDNPNATPSPI